MRFSMRNAVVFIAVVGFSARALERPCSRLQPPRRKSRPGPRVRGRCLMAEVQRQLDSRINRGRVRRSLKRSCVGA